MAFEIWISQLGKSLASWCLLDFVIPKLRIERTDLNKSWHKYIPYHNGIAQETFFAWLGIVCLGLGIVKNLSPIAHLYLFNIFELR